MASFENGEIRERYVQECSFSVTKTGIYGYLQLSRYKGLNMFPEILKKEIPTCKISPEVLIFSLILIL